MADLYSALTALEAWHWLSIGVVLVLIELSLVGAYFLLCSGAAAVLVGAIMFLAPDLPWQGQFAIWAIVTLKGIAGWYFYAKINSADAPQSDEPALNQRGQRYVGRSFTLEHDIPANEAVQHPFEDSFWMIKSDSALPKDSRVQVTKVDGTILIVSAA